MIRTVAAVVLVSLSLNAFGFGNPGAGGYDGYDGYPGNNGQDVSINVDGRALELRLDGTDGTPGGDGTNGESASSCYFSPGVGKEYGAAGGSAGRGGNGGSGGRGGHATFFVKKLSDLNSIFLTQIGGKGAPGGKPGVGGAGCGCSPSSWTAQTCDTRRVCSSSGGCSESVSCTDRTFYCYAGENGYNGAMGSHGSDGGFGQIAIVTNLAAIPEELPSATISLKALKEKSLKLSKNLWDVKSGARALFAEGSQIQDNYSLFNKKVERTVTLDWKVKRDFADFAIEQLAINFDGHKIDVKYLGTNSLKFKLIEGDSTTVILIEEAYKVEDMMLISLVGINGNLSKTSITLKDISGLGLVIKTNVTLYMEYKHWLKGWQSIYATQVPAEALEFKEGGIVIKVGQLPMREKNALKAGNKVRYKVNLKRTLGTASKDINFDQQEDTL